MPTGKWTGPIGVKQVVVNSSGQSMDARFVADAMLGALAKWLRVLGYDTHYQSRYGPGDLGRLAAQGRVLLSRTRKAVGSRENAVLIGGDHVGGQLAQVREALHLRPDPALWFTRCLVCNTRLEEALGEAASESVPEYVFHQTAPEIRCCPRCKRFFWPGSHRERMLGQLRGWGFHGNRVF